MILSLGSVERKRLEDAKAPEQLIVCSTRPPMLLDRQPLAKDATGGFAALVQPAFPQTDGAQFLPPIEGIFQEGADTNMYVVVGLSDELKKRSFHVPAFKFEPSGRLPVRGR